MSTTTKPRETAFGAFMRQAAERTKQRQDAALAKADAVRRRQAAELRHPDGPVSRGPATLADVLGVRAPKI
jgi:hypothetical protein